MRKGCAALPDVRLRRMAEEAAAREDDVRLYAALREMIRQETGKTLFETQLAAAFAMQQGKIAELPTRGGKTLCAVLTAAALAFRGTPVHVLAFNDYLAARDCALGTPVFCALRLTASCVWRKPGRRHNAPRIRRCPLHRGEGGRIRRAAQFPVIWNRRR